MLLDVYGNEVKDLANARIVSAEEGKRLVTEKLLLDFGDNRRDIESLYYRNFVPLSVKGFKFRQ